MRYLVLFKTVNYSHMTQCTPNVTHFMKTKTEALHLVPKTPYLPLKTLETHPMSLQWSLAGWLPVTHTLHHLPPIIRCQMHDTQAHTSHATWHLASLCHPCTDAHQSKFVFACVSMLVFLKPTFHPVHHLARAPFAHRLHHQRHRGNFAPSLRCAQVVLSTLK